MTMTTIFFTGFPGFLGSSLLPHILARNDESVALCLVQPKFARLARERVATLERTRPALRGRIRLVQGDISAPGLVVDGQALPRGDISEIYHLAAVYDLSVRRELAHSVNVAGTRHVLELAAGCSGLERLHYVSTCYVSGRHPGTFTEHDLDAGQRFNNYYEESKYLAEVAVQERMRDGLPGTIYRPSIIVGDSRSGMTQKYDGPYAALRLLLRQPRVAVMPVIGDTTRHRMNIVSCDFVVDAIAYLSSLARSAGVVYQLADPSPPTIDAILRSMGRATGRSVLRVRLPLAPAQATLRYIPGVYELFQISPEGLSYYTHPTSYTTARADADLAGTGIRVRPFVDYLDTLTEFLRRNPTIGAHPMV
jgi:thioester reductase-like protein